MSKSTVCNWVLPKYLSKSLKIIKTKVFWRLKKKLAGEPAKGMMFLDPTKEKLGCLLTISLEVLLHQGQNSFRMS